MRNDDGTKPGRSKYRLQENDPVRRQYCQPGSTPDAAGRGEEIDQSADTGVELAVGLRAIGGANGCPGAEQACSPTGDVDEQHSCPRRSHCRHDAQDAVRYVAPFTHSSWSTNLPSLYWTIRSNAWQTAGVDGTCVRSQV